MTSIGNRPMDSVQIGKAKQENMKNSRYRYRYPLKIFKLSKFWRRKSVPVSNFSDTGSEAFFLVPNLSDTGSETFFRYQIVPIPVPRLFPGTKFFRYRFRDFFRYQFVPIPVAIPQKNEKIPVPVCHTLVDAYTGHHFKAYKFEYCKEHGKILSLKDCDIKFVI